MVSSQRDLVHQQGGPAGKFYHRKGPPFDCGAMFSPSKGPPFDHGAVNALLSNGEHALTQPLPPSRKCGKGHRCGDRVVKTWERCGERSGEGGTKPPLSRTFPVSAGRRGGQHPSSRRAETRTRFQAWAEAAVVVQGRNDRSTVREPACAGLSAAIAPARSARKEWRDPGAIGRSWDDALSDLVAVHRAGSLAGSGAVTSSVRST